MLVLLIACAPVQTETGHPGGRQHTATVEDTGPDEDDTADDPDLEAAAAEAFYALGVLQELRLTLTADTIADLNRQARQGNMEYLSGDITVNGTAFQNVGVRIKGSSTLRNFNDKPSLKIKLNAFVKGQDYAGLERITLNNMVEDSTQTKEVLVYTIFRGAGLLASRANHAAVYVNDELYGLYTNLETVDDHWLDSRFADRSGELFEANDNADFTRSGLANWESASGVGDTTQLVAVSDAIRAAGINYSADLDAVVDLKQFQSFWVWSLLVGNVDGYPYTLNDCYVYADPKDNFRLQFAPWGVDESWNSGAPGYWRHASGALADGCLKNDACEAEILAAVDAQLLVYEALPIAEWFDTEGAATADVLAADPRRTWTTAQVADARTKLLEEIALWPDRMREAIGG